MKKYIIPYVTNLTIMVTLLSVIIALTDATAQECSDFETAVFRLADEAETFQMTPEFCTLIATEGSLRCLRLASG